MLFCLKHFNFNFRGLKVLDVETLPNENLSWNLLKDVNAIFLKPDGKPQIDCEPH